MAYTRKNSHAPAIFSAPFASFSLAKTPRVPSTFILARAPFQFYAWIPAPSRQNHRVANHPNTRSNFQLIRWQLLAVIDARWEFCPAILVVPAGRIRAAHLTTLIHQTATDIARPCAWRLCSLRTSAAQRFFERLQIRATLIPGHVTPHRDRDRAVRQLAHTCQSGQADPRRHFLPFTVALDRVISCIQFADTEPVTSPAGWGCWIPWEKFDQQIKEKVKNFARPQNIEQKNLTSHTNLQKQPEKTSNSQPKLKNENHHQKL